MLGTFINIILMICAFTLFMLLIMLIKGKQNHLTIHKLEFNNFPDSLKTLTVFFISDIHRRKISEKLLEKIPDEVDVVMIGGDITESGVPFSRVDENLKILSGLGPTYFVYGNNDYEVDRRKLEALLDKHNVHVLNNTCTVFTSTPNGRIVLLGVEDMSKERDRLDLALNDTDLFKTDFKLLLCHNPEIYHKISHTDRISLVLSGHTHGGQIRFLGLGLYKKGRMHHLKNSTLLVSNGYGTTAFPLRLGAPAEAHYLYLTRK